MAFYVRYRDDGPRSPVAQSLRMTRAADILMVFDSYDDFRERADDLMTRGRNARFEGGWSDESDEDGWAPVVDRRGRE